MEWFAWLGWILAAAAGGAALFLARRVSALSSEVARAARGSSVTPASVAAAGAQGSGGSAPAASPVQGSGHDGKGGMETVAPVALTTEEEALRSSLAFLDRAIRPSVEEARRLLGEGAAAEALERALDAMGDLAFLAAPPPEEPLARENLAQVVQEAVREYTIETRIPVRVHSPPQALHVTIRREALKDAVFMILANAGRFSEGRPVDVYLEKVEPGGFRIRVADEGPGFSDEALARALEPFWTTDPLGVGMGLPQARARVATMKGRLSLRNRTSGGGEVVMEFPED